MSKKTALALCVALLSCGAAQSHAADQVFVVDKPLDEIATNLLDTPAEQAEQTKEMARYAIRLLGSGYIEEHGPHLHVYGFASPSDHYYRSHVCLVKPYSMVGCFTRTVQIWGQPGRTVVQVSITLDTTRQFRLPIIQRIKNRIVARVTCQLLNQEVARLCQQANVEPDVQPERDVLLETVATAVRLVALLIELVADRAGSHE